MADSRRGRTDTPDPSADPPRDDDEPTHASEHREADLGALSEDRLYSLFYDVLRDLAERRMSRADRRSATLQPTSLVHEAYLRLIRTARWNSRAHFFGAAANAMRQVLIEHARRRAAVCRGGDAVRVELEHLTLCAPASDIDVLALDEALTAFESIDPRAHRVVTLRCFAGLGLDEIAESLSLSARTVKRDWRVARLWLLDRLEGGRR